MLCVFSLAKHFNKVLPKVWKAAILDGYIRPLAANGLITDGCFLISVCYSPDNPRSYRRYVFRG